MREVSEQTRQHRARGEVNGREEECWQKEKRLLTLQSTFLVFWGAGWGRKKKQQCVAGFPNTPLRSAPLSALSQWNG